MADEKEFDGLESMVGGYNISNLADALNKGISLSHLAGVVNSVLNNTGDGGGTPQDAAPEGGSKE